MNLKDLVGAEEATLGLGEVQERGMIEVKIEVTPGGGAQ